jgi:hypothetical protein
MKGVKGMLQDKGRLCWTLISELDARTVEDIPFQAIINIKIIMIGMLLSPQHVLSEVWGWRVGGERESSVGQLPRDPHMQTRESKILRWLTACEKLA